jgi:hypothetical protein
MRQHTFTVDGVPLRGRAKFTAGRNGGFSDFRATASVSEEQSFVWAGKTLLFEGEVEAETGNVETRRFMVSYNGSSFFYSGQVE